jgi:ABC-type microcin C transport system permease subunit YejE
MQARVTLSYPCSLSDILSFPSSSLQTFLSAGGDGRSFQLIGSSVCGGLIEIIGAGTAAEYRALLNSLTFSSSKGNDLPSSVIRNITVSTTTQASVRYSLAYQYFDDFLSSFISVILSMIPGIILGLVAAFFPKYIGAFIMRVVDITMAFPFLLLAIVIVIVLSPSLATTVVAVSIVNLPAYVRMMRAEAMSQMNRDYVMASRVSGAGLLRIMFVSVLPNCMAPLIVQGTMGFSSAILEIAALGFLGMGIQPPAAEWGTMLSSARDYISSAWWVVTFPGITILISVLSINLMGDGLRDALDPKMKKIG